MNRLGWNRIALLLFLGAGLGGMHYAMAPHNPQLSLPPISQETPVPDVNPPHLDLPVRFVNIASSAGLRYRWSIPGPRPLNILQTIGNGCAFLDYNNDGNLDILLVGPQLALYKGDGQGHFTDVTHQVGLDKFHGHFLGCAVGDYDNDGYDDLYISGWHTGFLLHNEHGTGFKDVTQEAGLKPQPWGTSCAFGDVDNDGKLDLYVCNYVAFSPSAKPQLCAVGTSEQYKRMHHGATTIFAACPPEYYSTQRGVLYHNVSGHKFVDVTAAWGAVSSGNGLGVAFAPFDTTKKLGFAVSNDNKPGDLFQDTEVGRLHNIGTRSGTAFDHYGKKAAGMGLDWGDYDNDGRLDLFVTAFSRAAKNLYHNEGNDIFTCVSTDNSFGKDVYNYLPFGCKWLDADNSGWLDLLLANGDVEDNIHDWIDFLTYHQPTLFLYNKKGTLMDATMSVRMDKLPMIVGRGLAIGDFDNDGRVDALVVDSEGKPLLLHNESKKVGHWLSFTLVGTKSNRDGYGALVTVKAGGLTQTRLCHADGSYLSSSDKRVHVGLGSAKAAESVSIKWPDGHTDAFRNISADRFLRIHEGETKIR